MGCVVVMSILVMMLVVLHALMAIRLAAPRRQGNDWLGAMLKRKQLGRRRWWSVLLPLIVHTCRHPAERRECAAPRGHVPSGLWNWARPR